MRSVVKVLVHHKVNLPTWLFHLTIGLRITEPEGSTGSCFHSRDGGDKVLVIISRHTSASSRAM